MASLGLIESYFNALPREARQVMVAFARGVFPELEFGTPDTDGATRATNFRGHLVPFVTSSTPGREVAVAHLLARVPRLVLPALNPNQVGAGLTTLSVTRAADRAYVYLASPDADLPVVVYLE